MTDPPERQMFSRLTIRGIVRTYKNLSYSILELLKNPINRVKKFYPVLM